MTQMIARYTISDFARFKTQFDADAEDRGNNGLSLLQLWREGDGSAWALYQVGNAAKAQEYLGQAAAVFNSQAGVSDAEFHLVETA
ncbi:hypothetical protein [Paracoccus shanxieyensis]|uniref:Uncharacterized protein n=1 Tax=Paracoccus shanxieyensis TaxID=2675752 RepID=A0A6L6IYB5_9RHOB|nr:hypothetical protein [Paracoccus shanxieyensis]MTH64899.1 hypothetical protein [Paracoccus shanxieyensis]MTH88197.1 hypothetical protein [Paracoccus shanxieyensis]